MSVHLHFSPLKNELVVPLGEFSGSFGYFSLHIFENIETRNRDLDCPYYAWRLDIRSM